MDDDKTHPRNQVSTNSNTYRDHDLIYPRSGYAVSRANDPETIGALRHARCIPNPTGLSSTTSVNIETHPAPYLGAVQPIVGEQIIHLSVDV